MDKSIPEDRAGTHKLETILNQCWSAFSLGVEEANSPWRLPVVGTTGSTGAELRTVVLREADEDRRSLVFHTDARSRKVNELEESGHAAWLFFDPQSGVQIRARSRVAMHLDDELTRKLWECMPQHARGNYSNSQSPGEPTVARPETSLCDEEAFLNFVVVECEVVFLDWLQISKNGHQRAQFSWDGHTWIGVSVAP